MAPADSNWLSFSLSSMEMLASSQSPHQLISSTPTLYHHQHHQPPPSQHFLLDNFYANEWVNAKAVEEMNHDPNRGFGMLTGYLDPQQIQNQSTVPKLEDFLGGDTTSSLNTQDSSTLTHIYDPNASASTYFNDVAQDLKEIALPAPAVVNGGGGFQAFSANSGSDVDDSASIGRGASQLACAEFVGQAIESHGELGFSSSQFGSGGGGALSLTVAQSDGGEKAIVVAAESSGGKKVSDTFGQRTSIYRGVTRHRWTGRYEAHLWDNSCRREGQARKGRQVYLGGYDKEDKAARAYDLAALKYWGPSATTNFPISSYSKEVEDMKHMTKQEFIASLRRKSSGFSRGASIYRGVTRHHQQGRWQARIGRVAGNKDLYLGTFATEEEAAEAYDIAAIKFRGVNAVTNFEMNRYDVEAILKSALPVGGAAKRLKVSPDQQPDEQKPVLSLEHHQPQEQQQGGSSGSINFASVFHHQHQHQHQQQPIPYALPLDAASFYQQGYFHHYNGGNGNGNGNGVPMMGTDSAVVSPVSLLPPPAEFYLWPHPHQPY